MIAFAFSATVINYLDRQALSVAAPVLKETFLMTNVSYSRVVFCFLLAYTVMNGVSGALIDRLGTKVGYALCVGWWSFAAALHATISGVAGLGFVRFLLGLGEAGNWPAGVKIVTEWFPPDQRALAAGIFNSGSAVGAILAPPLMATVILNFGWRAAFLVVGSLGFVWLILWLQLYRAPQAVASAAVAKPLPLATLLRSRFVGGFTLAKIFIDPVWYFYIFWFPEYLKVERGFDLASVGRYAWIPFAVAGTGNLFGGGLSGILMRQGMNGPRARKIAVSLFAALMLSAIPAVRASGASSAIAWVSLAMLGYTGALANMMAMPADRFPKEAVASVYGLASMGSGFGGMVFTLATGWLVDRFSFFPVFYLAGTMPIIGAGVLWIFSKERALPITA